MSAKQKIRREDLVPGLEVMYKDHALKRSHAISVTGTGFSEKGLAEAIDRLRPLFTDKPTVKNPPNILEKIQWVQPKLVCEVAFAEWTGDEQLRQTTFLGWRDDKSPEDLVLELQECFDPVVLMLRNLRQLEIIFPSAGLVRCFGEYSRCAVAGRDGFLGRIVRL